MKSLARSLMLMLALSTGACQPVPVLPPTFEQSFQAFERQDYRTAFAGFKKLAEQGDAQSQYNLGYMYADGQGVPKDDQQAVAWFRKAAEQRFFYAMCNLGLRYADGRGLPKDEQQAMAWLRKAALGGIVVEGTIWGLLM